MAMAAGTDKSGCRRGSRGIGLVGALPCSVAIGIPLALVVVLIASSAGRPGRARAIDEPIAESFVSASPNEPVSFAAPPQVTRVTVCRTERVSRR